MGITESAEVATIIFILHLSTMLFLILSGGWFVIQNGLSVASANFHAPVQGGIFTALVLGFSTAILGISGFESSANFVEEQAPGVFPKTLRNMWVAVSVINPLMALTAVLVLPLSVAVQHQEALLSYLGDNTGGKWLATAVSIDAVLVLSGAVLTSYVGVGGAVEAIFCYFDGGEGGICIGVLRLETGNFEGVAAGIVGGAVAVAGGQELIEIGDIFCVTGF